MNCDLADCDGLATTDIVLSRATKFFPREHVCVPF